MLNFGVSFDISSIVGKQCLLDLNHSEQIHSPTILGVVMHGDW